MTKSIYFHDSFGGYIRLNLDASIVFSERDVLLVDAHLPGVVQSNSVEKGKACIITIELIYSSQKHIEYHSDSVRVFDQFQRETPLYLFHLLYSTFHINWLNKGIYSIHGACISKDDFTILLVGHSGVGKTTLSLNLIKDHGFKLICSDRTLLMIEKENSFLIPLDGTKAITYKHSNPSIPTSILIHGAEYVDRNIKTLIPDYLKVRQPKSVNAIIFPRLDGKNTGIFKMESFEALVALYPFFLDVWNSDALIFGGSEVYEGGRIDINTKHVLLNGLQRVIKKTPILTATGSLEHTIRLINDWVDKQIYD